MGNVCSQMALVRHILVHYFGRSDVVPVEHSIYTRTAAILVKDNSNSSSSTGAMNEFSDLGIFQVQYQHQ